MPRISVITATYNRPDVLRWAIESVRAQTFEDYEHVVVGDACTDHTEAVVASFDDPRIRFVNLAVNCGEQSGPNNAGFDLARGEYIAYLNHDDLWAPDHLALLLEFITTTNADLVYALPLSIDIHGMSFCGATNAELRYDPRHFVPASLWLARRTLISLLGGWRGLRATHIRNPSQDLLFRAWKQSCDLRCHPKFSVVTLSSARAPGAYLKRDDRQHREIFERLQRPGFREELATELASRLSRQPSRSITSLVWWRWILARLFDRIAVELGQHPDGLRNNLLRRPRGWWIDHLREVRGLPPLPDRKQRR